MPKLPTIAESNSYPKFSIQIKVQKCRSNEEEYKESCEEEKDGGSRSTEHHQLAPSDSCIRREVIIPAISMEDAADLAEDALLGVVEFQNLDVSSEVTSDSDEEKDSATE